MTDAREDRRQLKADAATAKARAKAARPFWRKKRFLLPVGLVVVVGAIAAMAGGGDKDKTVSHPPEQDVAITTCDVDTSTQWASARLHVTNNSSKASDYFITIQIEQTDGALWDTAQASVTALAPGQSTDETAQSLKADAPAGLTCRAQKVSRIQTLSR